MISIKIWFKLNNLQLDINSTIFIILHAPHIAKKIPIIRYHHESLASLQFLQKTVTIILLSNNSTLTKHHKLHVNLSMISSFTRTKNLMNIFMNHIFKTHDLCIYMNLYHLQQYKKLMNTVINYTLKTNNLHH